MPGTDTPPPMFAARLTRDGTVREVLSDGLDIGLGPGAPFADAAGIGDRDKVRAFLAQLRVGRSVCGWLIRRDLDRHPPVLVVCGCLVDDDLVVIALPAAGVGGAVSPSEQAALDEMSRLNNELATLQRELAQSNRQLRLQAEERSRMLAMISHDIRSPMTAVFGYLDLLGRYLGDDIGDRERQALERVQHNASAVLRLIEDLLQVARNDKAQFRLDPRPVPVEPLLRRVRDATAVDADRKDIRLEIAQAPTPAILADLGRVEQALVNLIGNAIKYSPSGTTVRVHTLAAAGMVEFVVSDQGPGIPEAERTRIFEPFVRGSSNPTGGEGSTGLGLAIVHQVATLHGGRVWVDDAPGGGAAFHLAVPAAPESTGEAT